VTPPGSDPPPPFDWTYSAPPPPPPLLPPKWDGFILSLNYGTLETTLARSTFIGGTDHEEPGGLDVDQFGKVHFSGDTKSSVSGGGAYPTTSTGYRQDNSGLGYDGVYTVMDSELSMLCYSTYMGSTTGESLPDDRGRALDLIGRKTYISGDTASFGFIPVPPPPAVGFQPSLTATPPPGPQKVDGFLFRFNW